MAKRQLTDNEKLNIALTIMTDDEVGEFQDICEQYEQGETPDGWEGVI